MGDARHTAGECDRTTIKRLEDDHGAARSGWNPTYLATTSLVLEPGVRLPRVYRPHLPGGLAETRTNKEVGPFVVGTIGLGINKPLPDRMLERFRR